MPKRQTLLGLWLLTCGLSLLLVLTLALWLESQLLLTTELRLVIWSLAALSPLTLLLLGWVLEQRLLGPLRRLQIQCARLAANPDARDDFPPEGWLSSLKPDLDRLRGGWREDREKLQDAREAGARDAARIRHELEAVLRVLDTPLLLCDSHQRVLMLNPAAEQLFAGHPALGLGRHLQQLLPLPNLTDTLKRLPQDGSPRQLLVHFQERWLRCQIRRVRATQGEALLTLEDTTDSHSAMQRWRQPLSELLPRLRGHTANLVTTADALSSADATSPIRQRLEDAVHQESQNLSELISQLGRLLESAQLDQGRLTDTWSNDLINALAERYDPDTLALTAIGIPTWFRADSPIFLAMLERLLPEIQRLTATHQLDVETCLGNRRVYLDFIWAGQPISQQTLNELRHLPISEQPLAPRMDDVLQQHNSDWWCLPDQDHVHARLRLPLPVSERFAQPPGPARTERPEFHDFSIADLPPPDKALADLPLKQLDMVVFDTETTGLKLRSGDSIISIGACRILQGRLLANERFEQLVNPGRPIPPESTQIHGLTDLDVQKSPPLTIVLPRFRSFVGQAILVAHNAAFDLLALNQQAQEAGVTFNMPVLDTLLLSRAIDPDFEGHGLDALAERFQIQIPQGLRHTALGDAQATAELLLYLLPRLEARGITTLDEALKLQAQMEPIQVG